jgi:serine/threonine protein kinase
MKVKIGNSEFDFVLSGLRKIGRGGEGDIYLLHHQGKSYALKIYFEPSLEKKNKVLAMIENAPDGAVQAINALTIIQLAWPVGICFENDDFRGFVMPYVDLSHSNTLDFYLDKKLYEEKFPGNPLSLPFKIDIAKNLASVIKLLHSKGHFFIDFKPQNVRVYDRYNLISLIDCDGFSILSKDGRRFLAKSYSSEYIAPEALQTNSQPEVLSIDQDLFALSVVLFQLLNFGIHPYSGLITQGDAATTTDDKVSKGYYPYGKVGHPKIQPIKGSVHKTIDDSIMALFDRAFSNKVQIRPSIDEWVNVFDSIQKNKKLVKCSSQPNKLDHIHFEGKECQSCLREGLATRVKVKSKIPSLNSTKNPFYTNQQPTSVSSSGLLPFEKWILYALGGVIAIAILMNLGDDKSSSKSNTVAQSSTVTQAYSNPILDISGKWGDDSLCAEYMRILPSSSSQNSDLLQFAFNSRELINFRIKSIEKIPPNDYKLFIKSLDNVIEDEIIFRKLNTDRLQFFRHVRHKPEFETFIINGKDFKTEESVVTFQGCK